MWRFLLRWLPDWLWVWVFNHLPWKVRDRYLELPPATPEQIARWVSQFEEGPEITITGFYNR